MVEPLSSTQRIQALSPHLVNQIAAGEVIERPASVVKELVENSIDAGAMNISVELEEGGKRLIRVVDDGLGIHPDDLPLAMSSHATSKLRDEAGLHSILTLGFRGEALASISSVSEVDLVSRPHGQEAGERMTAADGQCHPGAPEAMPHGTRMSVRNLFYNVPARKRFLKSERAELSRIKAMLQQLALATPTIGFSLIADGRVVFRFSAEQSPLQRIGEVLGSKVVAQMMELPSKPGLWGWVGRPESFKRTSDAIYTFLNGRFIKDKSIVHALRESYSDFQIPGRYPQAVIFLDVDPAEVDVNVHPTKHEVRFRDKRAIYSLVHRSVKEALSAAGCVPELFSPSGAGARSSTTAGSSFPIRDATAPGINPFPSGLPSVPSSPTSTDALHVAEGALASFKGESDGQSPAANTTAAPELAAFKAGEELVDGRLQRVIQMRNSYLIVEEEDGLTVIDQHALHEKIIYEEICEAQERGDFKQPLLIPETLQLGPKEWQAFEESADALKEMGFDVEEFGDDTIVLRSVPSGFSATGANKLLRSVLRRLADAVEHGASTEIELKENLLATVACKRAIKAGQALTPEMQLDLLKGRSRAFQPQNCPHGRPSELFISWAELERRFDRK